MSAAELYVYGIGDNLRLCSCVGAPKQENNGRGFVVKLRNNAVGELLPALALMGICLTSANG